MNVINIMHIISILFAVPGIQYMLFVNETRLSVDAYEMQLYTNTNTGDMQFAFPIPAMFHVYYNTTLSTPQVSNKLTTRNSKFTINPPVIGDIYKMKIKVELIAESPFEIFGMDMEPFYFNTSK